LRAGLCTTLVRPSPKDIAMNIQSDWPRIKNDVSRRWPNLSVADVARIDGDTDELCSVLEERYHISREDAERQVQDFLGKEGISAGGDRRASSSSAASRNQPSGAGTRPESGSSSGKVWQNPSRVPGGSQTSDRGPAPMSADERRRKEEERKSQSRGTEEKTETPEESGE
jgi:hypothetical protein